MKTAIVAMLLLLCPSLHAQPFYRNWKWWVGTAAIGGAITLDLMSSARVASVCPGCQDSNPIIGSNTSAHFVRGGLVALAWEGGMHAVMYHYSHDSHHEAVRAAGYLSMPAQAWILHGAYAARWNYGIVNHCLSLPGGRCN